MSSSDRPTLICLTPVRNEAWILDRFLRAASLWADHIVIADQMSDDGSREIAGRHPKVTLIDNKSPVYDEGARQNLLLQAGRALPVAGKRILIALDADEALSANVHQSSEWDQALSGAPGTVLRFGWANILPDRRRCWIPKDPIAFGFVDDGRAHSGHAIHSTRIPAAAHAPAVLFKDVKVLHFQYTNWERMLSKQRWYQVWERLNYPRKRAVAIFRQYHHMNGWPSQEIHAVQPEWMAGYEQAGIDFSQVASESVTWWDRQIVDLLLSHGAERFRKIAIWDRNWREIAMLADRGAKGESLEDPRTPLDRVIHRWLSASQPHLASVRVRLMQQVLRVAGW